MIYNTGMLPQNFTPDFDHLRTLLTSLSQTSIHLIERMNLFFADMSPQLMKFAAKQLREEWQQKCGKTDRVLFHNITRIINTLAREQVAFMDEKFMQLAMGVNLYYGYKVIDIRKEKQYRLHCPYCLRYVSNNRCGRMYHMNACPNNFRYYIQKRRRVRRAQRIQKLREEFTKQGIYYGEFPPTEPPVVEDGDYQPKTIMQKGIASLPTYVLGEKYQHSHQIQLKVHQYYMGSTNFDFLNNEMIVIKQEDDNDVYDQSKMAGVKVQAQLQDIYQQEQEYSQQESQQGEMETERSNVMIKQEEDEEANIYQFNQYPWAPNSHQSKGSNEPDHNVPQRMEERLKYEDELKEEQLDYHQHRQGFVPKIQNQVDAHLESQQKDKQKQQ